MAHWIRLVKVHLIAAFSCLWDQWKVSYSHFTVFKHLRITSGPSILETWKHCDYMHFTKTNPMNHKSLNSDHWLSRKCDLTFCKKFKFWKNFINFDTYKFHNVSFSIDPRKMKFGNYIYHVKMQWIWHFHVSRINGW